MTIPHFVGLKSCTDHKTKRWRVMGCVRLSFFALYLYGDVLPFQSHPGGGGALTLERRASPQVSSRRENRQRSPGTTDKKIKKLKKKTGTGREGNGMEGKGREGKRGGGEEEGGRPELLAIFKELVKGVWNDR